MGLSIYLPRIICITWSQAKFSFLFTSSTFYEYGLYEYAFYEYALREGGWKYVSLLKGTT